MLNKFDHNLFSIYNKYILNTITEFISAYYTYLAITIMIICNNTYYIYYHNHQICMLLSLEEIYPIGDVDIYFLF